MFCLTNKSHICSVVFVKLLSVNEAAAVLSVSKRTIQQLTADRALAVVKFGRNVRYDIDDLTRFAESRKIREVGWKKTL